jgi:hypothetical protein
VVEERVDGANEVLEVNPGHELTSAAGRASQTASDERQKRVEYAPASGLIVIADRSATLRVFGVAASWRARSHACATSMLKFQVPGAPGSCPPIWPVGSSFGASKR